MATAAPDDELPRGIARFWSADGQVTGSGFLIAERTLCTCAHVVASALGTDETADAPPTAPVTLDFPLLMPPSARLRATVTHWRPVSADGGGDIALLNLTEPVPGTAPVRFAGGTAVWNHAFRVLGFPLRTDDHGVWVDGRLRAPVGKGWTSMEARPLTGGPAIGRGFSGGPVWDTDQGGVVGMTVAAETGTGATTAYLIPAALLLGLDPTLRPSPFRGLEPFREQDASVFFARRADSERIVRAVCHQPFVPVAGASGVGKSSLLRAGALPLLRAAGYTVTDFVGQPGAAPVRVLMAALREQFPQVSALWTADGTMTDASAVLIGARLLEHSGPAGHVVVLDQFEETVGAEPARARDLLDILLTMAAARHPDGRHLRVLTTLRSASLEDLVAGGGAERLSVTVQMLAPMTPPQLAEIVRRPVESVPGVDFEPGLAERIVTDAGTEPGALPLVQFVLSELWDHRDRGRLTHDAYVELGGVDGALASYADQQLTEVCKAPGGPELRVARRLFEQLTLPDGDQGYARVARAYTALPAELRAAAQALAGTRLLVIGRDSGGTETVALAHESLVRQWPTLRGWLDESRAFRMWQERLRTRMREWEAGDRHTYLLLSGHELAAARAGELEAAEAEFVELSRRYRRKAVLQGRAGVALVTVLAVVAVTLFWFFRQAGLDAERTAREGAANELADRSINRSAVDPLEGAALAVLAERTESTKETYKALLDAYPGMAMVQSVEEGFLVGQVRAVAASADGSGAAFLEEDDQGEVRGYVITGLPAGKPEKHLLRGLPAGVDLVAVSDDGARVAVAGPDGQGKVWDSVGRRTVDEWSGGTGRVGRTSVGLDFSADGRLVLQVTAEEAQADTYCSGGTWAQEDVRLHLRDTRKRRPLGVPSGLIRADVCLTGAVLPGGGGKSPRMIVLGEDDGSVKEVRAHSLDTGDQEWQQPDLDATVLGAGGRTLGVSHEREYDGSFRDPVSGARREPAVVYRAQSDSEATGRFVSDSSSGSDTDVLWQDVKTGADYVTYRPPAYGSDGQGCPHVLPDLITRAEGEDPVLHVLCNRDLVSFRMREVPNLPRDAWLGGTVFDPPGKARATVGSTDSMAGEETRVVLSVLDGTRLRDHPVGGGEVTSDHGFGAPVFSGNGRFLVVWGRELGWELYEVRTDELHLITSHVKKPDSARPRSVVRGVRPLGKEDFLMLGAEGVQRIDRDGDVTSAHAPDCREPREKNPTHCLAVEVSPKDGTAWVLRRNGRLTSWEPDGGGERRTSGQLGVLADGPSRSGMRFREDGERLAVVLRDQTVLVDPATRQVTRQLPTSGHDAIGTYSRDGWMVLLPDLDDDAAVTELWKEDGEEAVGRLGTLRYYGAWRIAGEVVHHGTESGVQNVPLDRDTLLDTLCDALGDYDPRSLHVGLDSAAQKGAPCPKPQGGTPTGRASR